MFSREGAPQASRRLLLKGGNAFLFMDPRGDISHPEEGQGLYWEDTRHLSEYALSSWPYRLTPVDAVVSGVSHAQFAFQVDRPFIQPLEVTRERILAPHLLETMRVRNHGKDSTSLSLRLAYDADFADIFEVRGMVPRRHRDPTVDLTGRAVVFSREGGDGISRWTRLTFDPIPNRLLKRRMVWELYLAPQSETILTVQVESGVGSPPRRRELPSFSSTAKEVLDRTAERRQAWARVRAEGSPLQAWTEQATEDLLDLLIEVDGFEVPAAGLPWYATLFGRDSLIVGLQTVHVNPTLSMAILRALAGRQGRRHDAYREEDPGKILHEFNRGELAGEGSTPYGPYYGTVDATPLFLCLLHEVYRWTGDLAFCRELFPSAERAAAYVGTELKGPLGFLSYRGGDPPGLRHQGWKDGDIGILRPDKSQPDPPIASCEAQGYAYWGLRGFAEIAEALEADNPAPRAEASKLKSRFHDAFWMPDEDAYAIALEAQGRPISLVSSSPGHLLMCGILDAAQGDRVAGRLFVEDLHSGWGIRTLSEQAPYYDPVSYHHGSVWPHDTSLVAFGLARAGHPREASRLVEELSAAAAHFPQMRLPELFGGQLRGHDGPERVDRACDLQAWASGAPLLATRILLGMEADAGEGTLRLHPYLPSSLPPFRLGPLRVGTSRIEITAEGHEEDSRVRVNTLSGPELKVMA